jgi:hypothetical protein
MLGLALCGLIAFPLLRGKTAGKVSVSRDESNITSLENATHRFLVVGRSGESVGYEIGFWMLPSVVGLVVFGFLYETPAKLLHAFAGPWGVFALFYVAFAIWALLKARNVAYEDNIREESALEGLRQALRPYQRREGEDR